MGTGLRVLCAFIFFAAFSCGLCAAQEEVPIFQGFDFESGKIEGWELQGKVSGVLAPTLAEDGRGHYYLDSTNISTLRESFTLISPPFKIDCDTIAFLVKGQGARVIQSDEFQVMNKVRG